MKRPEEQQLLVVSKELYQYLLKMGANPEDAKDIIQETLLKILEIDTELPADKIRPWMYRVGTNLYFNLYNQTKRRRKILERFFYNESEEIKHQNDELYEALYQLELQDANLLILKYSEELSIKEIAFLRNRSEDSIKTGLYRARKKLKRRMELLIDGR